MGCACKKVERLDNKLSNRVNQEPKSGIRKVMGSLRDSVIIVLYRLLVGLMFLTVTPVIIIYLIFSFIFKGDLNITIPKSIVQKLKTSQNT